MIELSGEEGGGLLGVDNMSRYRMRVDHITMIMINGIYMIVLDCRVQTNQHGTSVNMALSTTDVNILLSDNSF